ncbi:Putative transmembrane protein HieC [hydrothermal vent metagenome]|uniref:Putative transmembrane protein HieC n=1 Tax=hydrothermal vent metagenome TaxID=652676 RepID=A0A1W1C9H3_9ZZZZ
MPKEKLKTLVYSFGKLLGILGLLFVFYTLSQEYTLSSFSQQFILFIDILPLLIILNILAMIIGIYAWYQMLGHYASAPLNYLTSYYYFSKTEIAKYLPGNIFHFIGRQALASKIGISQTQMAKISLLFSFLLLTGTVFITSIFAFISQEVSLINLILLGLSSLVSFVLLFLLYKTFPLSKKLFMNLYLALSVALQGILLAIIVAYQSESFSSSLFFLCVAIYSLSWLIGFVTPGASGGLGVREGAFIALVSYLNIAISSEIVIFSILLVRLINIVVDILLYLSTFMIENKIKEVKI